MVPASEIDIEQADGMTPLLTEVIPLHDSLGALNGIRDAALFLILDPDHCEALNVNRFALSCGLNARETLICHALLKNMTTRQIAEQLGLQPDQSKQACAALFRAVGVQNRHALLRRTARVAPAIL